MSLPFYCDGCFRFFHFSPTTYGALRTGQRSGFIFLCSPSIFNHATAVYMYMYLHFFQLDARFKKTFYRDSLRVQKKKNLEIFDFGQEVSIPVHEHPSIWDLRNYHYPILIYCCNQVNDSSSMIIKWKMFMEKIYLYSEKELQNSVCMHVQLIFFNSSQLLLHMWHFSEKHDIQKTVYTKKSQTQYWKKK